MPTSSSDLATVSVIIPAYNRAGSILRAIKSVERQKYKPIEVLVVDDCSSDDTASIAENYDCKVPLRVVRLKENRGPAYARNKGIELARGNFVSFLDSDDFWMSNKLGEQVALVLDEELPHQTVVYSRILIKREYGSVVQPARHMLPEESVADYIFLNRGIISSSTFLVSRDFALRVQYDVTMRLHEDWDFFIRLQRAGAKFVMAPDVLSVWDDRRNSTRGSRPQPGISLSWLEKQREYIPRNAYLALRAKIAPQLGFVHLAAILSYVWAAYRAGAISKSLLALLCVEVFFPNVRSLARSIVEKRSLVDGKNDSYDNLWRSEENAISKF